MGELRGRPDTSPEEPNKAGAEWACPRPHPDNPSNSNDVIIAALNGMRTEGLTDLQKGQHIILLSELIEDEQLTDEGLEEFLTEARTYAEQLAAAY